MVLQPHDERVSGWAAFVARMRRPDFRFPTLEEVGLHDTTYLEIRRFGRVAGRSAHGETMP